ncbi:hypothetical protein F0562_015723 [Nyssa sinensis]|uniref:SHSP domain-containing protein n=1 Tax=Nyssa sinensis TaxID=561372 RepID=A0A5J4ZKS2_9ASTE|nr:hypothetical protein F0562_015723 [Nyssa sinensis]
MATKTEAVTPPSYDDFEPLCNWRREKGSDTLVLHIPEFKKDQLKVQITNLGLLKISGVRQVDSTKVSRFYKEIRVPKDCNADEIQAKLIGNLLHIIMPKNSNLVTQKDQPTSVQQPKVDENQPPSPDKSGGAGEESGGAVEKVVSRKNATMSGKVAIGLVSQQESSVSRLKRFMKVAMSVAVAVAVGAALGGYVMYKFRCLNVEN